MTPRWLITLNLTSDCQHCAPSPLAAADHAASLVHLAHKILAENPRVGAGSDRKDCGCLVGYSHLEPVS